MITRKILCALTGLMFVLAGVAIGEGKSFYPIAWLVLVLAIMSGTALEVERDL